MRAGRVVLFVLLAAALLAAVAYALTWRRAIEPIEPPPRSSFDSKLVAKGAELAAIGDCNACHTAPGGHTYAGGRALETPFGVIRGTNITPDPYTGIGRWSQDAFVRAMREGVDREGNHLYPAFPYNHFTIVADDDLAALYAYVMTRDPVRVETPPNDLRFPFNIRALVAGWKLLFLERRAFAANPQQSAEWNRGAYLVEGLAHCGACHTPRNRLGGEKKDERFAGGEIEGWHAPALNAAAAAPVPWTADRLFVYLRNGSEEAHGATAGPMVPVVHNLATVPEAEVRAIATYIASFSAQASPERQKRAQELLARAQSGASASPAASQDAGGAVYAGACAMCHDARRDPTYSGGALDLALSTSLSAPTSRNFLNFVLHGITPEEGARGRWMPAFGTALTDDQVIALANHLRRRVGAQPWSDLAGAVKQARQDGTESYARR